MILTNSRLNFLKSQSLILKNSKRVTCLCNDRVIFPEYAIFMYKKKAFFDDAIDYVSKFRFYEDKTFFKNGLEYLWIKNQRGYKE